jgi:hypothetical protein
MSTSSIAKTSKSDKQLASTNGHGPSPDPAPAEPDPAEAVADDPAAWTAEADFEALRIPAFMTATAKPTAVLKVVARAPRKQEWVRVRPGEAWRGSYGLLREEASGTLYAVMPALHDELGDELRTYWLLTAVNTERDVFLWPVPVGESHGRANSWWESMQEAASRAEGAWVRLKADQTLGRYEILEDPEGPTPVWPEATFGDLFKLGFKDHVIASLSHPFVRKLRRAV